MTIHDLSHIIQPFYLPPGINILILIIGFIAWFYSRYIGVMFGVIGIASLWLLSTPIVAYNLIDILQNKYVMLQPDSLDRVQGQDAIVVLGGGDAVEAEYGNKHTVSDVTLHRLRYASYLHDKTHLPIIVSGGRAIPSVESEAELMADVLRDDFNIQSEIKEDKSFNTADESKYIASILNQNHFHQIYLVTNAWHMPRSVYLFQNAGIKLTPAPMGYYIYGPGYALISFLPNVDALNASSIAIHEFLGMLWYQST